MILEYNLLFLYHQEWKLDLENHMLFWMKLTFEARFVVFDTECHSATNGPLYLVCMELCGQIFHFIYCIYLWNYTNFVSSEQTYALEVQSGLGF